MLLGLTNLTLPGSILNSTLSDRLRKTAAADTFRHQNAVRSIGFLRGA